jgi:hypothetical protein
MFFPRNEFSQQGSLPLPKAYTSTPKKLHFWKRFLFYLKFFLKNIAILFTGLIKITLMNVYTN